MFRSQFSRAVKPLVTTVATVGLASVLLNKSTLESSKRTYFCNIALCDGDVSPQERRDTLPKDPKSIKSIIAEDEETFMLGGMRYVGDLRDGLRCGKGESWDKWGHYKGEWRNDMKNGQGELEYDYGYVYKGEFAHNLPNGPGRLTLNNGKVFEGEFVNGILQARKVSVDIEEEELRYDGDLLDNQFHGRGRLVLRGIIFEGEFCDGLLHGQAKVTHPDGMVLEGEFVRNVMNGRGTLRYKDGTVEEGIFVNNKLNGPGCIKYPHGTVHTGNYIDSVPEGSGRLTHPDYTCEGNFIKGKLHGSIKFVNADGSIQESEYVDGVPRGRTKITLPSGETQEGALVKGAKFGVWVNTYEGKITTENHPHSATEQVQSWWRRLQQRQKKRE